jgi:hypothetical protein
MAVDAIHPNRQHAHHHNLRSRTAARHEKVGRGHKNGGPGPRGGPGTAGPLQTGQGAGDLGTHRAALSIKRYARPAREVSKKFRVESL